MNKKIMLAALLVSVAAAVSGTDFEERISRNIWYRDYFNEVIYRKDRNILVEHQPRLKDPYFDIDPAFFDDITYWFEDPGKYWDRLDCIKLDDSEYGCYIRVGIDGSRYKAEKVVTDLYEVELEDVRISEKEYEELLIRGHDRRFALEATEPEYSLFFRFDGEYLYIYLEDGKTLYATYCAYDESEVQALQEAIRTNEFDMTKITFPYHADGTCDYESGGGVPGKKIVNGVYRAKENLRLRAKEDISGETIYTMRAGAPVLILSLGKEETIDGITDNWVQVETQFGANDTEGKLIHGEVGWCFGGYLW